MVGFYQSLHNLTLYDQSLFYKNPQKGDLVVIHYLLKSIGRDYLFEPARTGQIRSPWS